MGEEAVLLIQCKLAFINISKTMDRLGLGGFIGTMFMRTLSVKPDLVNLQHVSLDGLKLSTKSRSTLIRYAKILTQIWFNRLIMTLR